MTDQGTEVAEPGTEVVPASEGSAGLVAQGDHAPVLDEAEQHHPTPRQYVLIAVVLVVVTGVEIATSYIDTNSNVIIVTLFLMGFVKFFLVCAWYMHMRTDQPFFRRVFIVGVVGATIVYGILLLMFSSTVLKA